MCNKDGQELTTAPNSQFGSRNVHRQEHTIAVYKNRTYLKKDEEIRKQFKQP
jgi:hypothetical protein